jgi:ribosomal protein S18 acetylase RimI-like enzyme
MNTASLAYRHAGEDDLPAVRSLVHNAYRGDASRVGWTTEADLLDGQRIDLDGLQALLQRPDSRIVLAFMETELVACAHIERLPNSGYFGMFAVQPTLQAGGLGRRVLAECERQLMQEMGCSAIEMTVLWQRSELIAWYQRRGYVLTGERRPFPSMDPRFGLPRRDDLGFVVLRKTAPG